MDVSHTHYMARDFGSWDDWLSNAVGQGQIVGEIELTDLDDALSRDLALGELDWSPALHQCLRQMRANRPDLQPLSGRDVQNPRHLVLLLFWACARVSAKA